MRLMKKWGEEAHHNLYIANLLFLSMKEQLKEAGLTANESKIYTSLLELGPSNAGLISRKSGLHRRVVYDTLEMLIQKGLVGYILKNNVRLFQASHPKRDRSHYRHPDPDDTFSYFYRVIPQFFGVRRPGAHRKLGHHGQ